MQFTFIILDVNSFPSYALSTYMTLYHIIIGTNLNICDSLYRFLRRSYKPRHSPEPGTDNADYDDPSCTISTQDLVNDPEPIYHKPVESPKRSASVECHYAETTVTTASSNPQPFNPLPKTEYADVRGYKNQEVQCFIILLCC